MACLFLFENPVDFFKVMLIVYRLPVFRIHDDHPGIGQVTSCYRLVIVAPFRI